MKLREIGTLIVIVIVVVSAGAGWLSSKWYGPDNVFEEKCEQVIQDRTGISTDLTPDSPEVKAPVQEVPATQA